MTIDVLTWCWRSTEEDGWEVWTPDLNGACIGSGATKAAALANTIQTLRETACALDVVWGVAKAREWKKRRRS